MKRLYLDKTKKYGKLQPLYEIPERAIGPISKRSKILWLFRCDCQNLSLHEAYRVKNGQITSCGCGRRVQDILLSSIKDLYTTYKYGAKSRGIKFELDFEVFNKLVQANCFYCGISGQLRKSRMRNKIQVTMNGIDRIDSKKSYILDNCVTCCKTCNRMKNDLHRKDFIDQCGKIWNYINKDRELCALND